MNPRFWYTYSCGRDPSTAGLFTAMLLQANQRYLGDSMPDCAHIPGIGWVWRENV
jgi:hypothetical protein